MGGVAAAIRSNNINGVVPLVAAFKDASLPPGVETLAELLDIKSNNILPGIYAIHGSYGIAIRYPYDMNAENLSHELLLMWANRSFIAIEVGAM
jgi:hypothetical protein